MKLIVRFSEFEYYDITTDSEIIKFMATTNEGTYWVEHTIDGEKKLRTDRNEFREWVVECMQERIPPKHMYSEMAN